MSKDNKKSVSIRLAIDIPIDVAAETFAKIEPVLSRISSGEIHAPIQTPPVLEQTSAELEEQRRKAEREAHFDEKIREFHQKKVQAYRTFRRIQANYEKPYDAYRVIAKQVGWPTTLIPSVLADRRKQIRNYIRERRKRIAVEMAFKGRTNHQIAKRLGVCTRTAARLLKEARASLIGGANA